jgi:LacI family transcriptional regulator
MKRLQLEDISKQLGYSKTLISMVLNGKGDQYGISKKTQAAVLKAVSELDYTPNKFARALRTGKSFFVGLIVADISNPFYSTIAKNIESVLYENGYNLMVCSTGENEEHEKRLVEMMINQQGVDGLIIASTFKTAEFYNGNRYTNTPFVFIDRVLPLYNANYVVIDNYGGSNEIVNHLIKQGCKTISCFSITPSYISTIEDRVNGYKDALTKNKLKVEDALMKSIRFDNIQKDVESSLTDLMNNHPNLDAVYCLNNNITTALLVALRKKEFEKLAAKIKIACFDDIDLFNIIDRKIISVSQPVEDIGKNSSLLMLDIINGKQTSKSNVVLSTSLIER